MSDTTLRRSCLLVTLGGLLAYPVPAIAGEGPEETEASGTPVVVTTVSAAAAQGAGGEDRSGWTPLDTDSFGDELFARWIPVPNGESGAPRQGWLGTADGFFTREAHLAYTYVDASGDDLHQVLARFHYPFSRRLWAGLEVPFYQDRGGQSDFGDVTLTTQVMLAETRNLSLNAGVGWRLPTGSASFGNEVFAAQPQLNLFTDIGSGFSFRGRVAYEFPDSGVPESFILNGAIGQTVTDHDRAPIGDLTWYVASTWREFDEGPSFVSVTPGMRTHVGGNLFLLAGIEIPLANSGTFFREGFTVQLVQGF